MFSPLCAQTNGPFSQPANKRKTRLPGSLNTSSEKMRWLAATRNGDVTAYDVFSQVINGCSTLSPLSNLKICVTPFIAEAFSSSSLSQSLKGQRFIRADKRQAEMANYNDLLDSRSGVVFAVSLFSVIASFLFVILRMISKVAILRKTSWDDSFVILAWVSTCYPSIPRMPLKLY
jgi:hypothetical protein